MGNMKVTKGLDKTIDIKTADGDVYRLSLFEYSRWLALLEGIERINQKAALLKIDLDNTEDWIKPLALEKYINERHEDILNDVIANETNVQDVKPQVFLSATCTT